VRWHRRARAGGLPRAAGSAVVRSGYRTRIGNDLDGNDHGYKIHLVYGALAAPSAKSYGTINDTPAAITFSWTITTTPVAVAGHKPTATLVIDSTKVDAAAAGGPRGHPLRHRTDDPRLPLPDEVLALLTGTGETNVDLRLVANQPTFDPATGVITLPAVAGVQWQVNGVNRAGGAQPALAPGAAATVDAVAHAGEQPGRRRRLDVPSRRLVVLDRMRS
jgi:hypothetical protein